MLSKEANIAILVIFITHTFTIRHCCRPPANDLNRLCCLFFSASFVSGMAKAEPSNLPDPEKNFSNFRRLAGEYTAFTVWWCFGISAYAPRRERLSVCPLPSKFQTATASRNQTGAEIHRKQLSSPLADSTSSQELVRLARTISRVVEVHRLVS